METKFFLLMTTILLLVFCCCCSPTYDHAPKCKLFSFGDSNSDIGSNCAAWGVIPSAPPGKTPSCRFSNGLLYIDFLCANLGMENCPSPYLESLDPEFSNGANFAFSAMTAQVLPNLAFTLAVQVQQFARFKSRVEQLAMKGKGSAISKTDFENAIFSVDIGQNDFSYPLSAHYNYTELTNDTIPNALNSIGNAAKALYTLGARKLILYNTGPIGCLPIFHGHLPRSDLHADPVGCVLEYNNIAKLFNDELALLATQLGKELPGATVVYIDMYTIKYELIANATKYGLKSPFDPCFNSKGPTVCLDPSRAVNWDGIHYTQAANKIVAARIVAGNDANPFTPLKELCQLVVQEE